MSKATSKKPARKPVEPRGRRGQSAVNTQPGLREWLIERLQQTPRPTLDELLEQVKSTGFAIGRTALWQFRFRQEKLLAERDIALRQAREYANVGDDQPLKVETSISTHGQLALDVDIKRRLEESGGVVTDEIQALLALSTKMQRSATQLARARSYIDRSVRAAMLSLAARMDDLLQDEHPDTRKIVRNAIEKAAEEQRQ